MNDYLLSGTVLVDNGCLDYFNQDQFVVMESKTFPSPTCKQLCREEYAGPYNFDLQFKDDTSMRKKWLYSSPLKKLYVSMLSKFSIKFKWDQMEPGLRVRAMLVYCSDADFEIPVLRCTNHMTPDLPCNIGFNHLDHVIRCYHNRAKYHKDADSGRRSVVVPLDLPPPGTDWVTILFTITCKNSCVGLNRRATTLIFTLERSNGEVIGRRKIGVRICSCPKRDKIKEESEMSVCLPMSNYGPEARNSVQNIELEDSFEVDINEDIIGYVGKEFIHELVAYVSCTIQSRAYYNGSELTPKDRDILKELDQFNETWKSVCPKKSKKRKIQ